MSDSPKQDPRYIDVYVDGKLMGYFCAEPDHPNQVGWDYSKRRIWNDELELVQVDGRKHFYRKIV